VDAPKTKTKDAWTSWKNRPYATGDDRKKQQAEAFEALNQYVQRAGAVITSPPGRYVRIEAPKGSTLPEKLRELGYNIVECGFVSRIVGSTNYATRLDEIMNGPPSPFVTYTVFELTLSGK
jgi:hypothetical protein